MSQENESQVRYMHSLSRWCDAVEYGLAATGRAPANALELLSPLLSEHGLSPSDLPAIEGAESARPGSISERQQLQGLIESIRKLVAAATRNV